MIRSRWRRLGSRSCLPLFTHLQRGSPAPQVGCPILPMHRMFQECGVSDNSAGVHPRVHSRPQDDERAVRQCCGGDHVREGGTRGCAGRMYHGEADQKHCCEMMTQGGVRDASCRGSRALCGRIKHGPLKWPSLDLRRCKGGRARCSLHANTSLNPCRSSD